MTVHSLWFHSIETLSQFFPELSNELAVSSGNHSRDNIVNNRMMMLLRDPMELVINGEHRSRYVLVSQSFDV
jgi:hypothetical protein